MDVHYLTLGFDCSPASALRNLQLREFALPFDWVVSTISSLEKCFKTNFKYFHRKLVFNKDQTRLIDIYGFEYPHDYPLNNMIVNNNTDTKYIHDIGEGVFGQEKGMYISHKWVEHYEVVLNKYNRRIERFIHMLNDPAPIIVLCRYRTPDILALQQLLTTYYKKENIYFVNSFCESFENNKIINIYTEQHNVWNETSIWKQGIDCMLYKIKQEEINKP